jgi:hypothetical protein
MTYQYVGNCTTSDAQSIWDMRNNSREVTWRTFRKHCPEARKLFEEKGGFWPKTTNKQIEDSGFFAFYKSTHRGTPCYYASWSGYEWIWERA